MDLGLNEQQEMLRKMARDFLTTECPKKLVRDMEEDEKGYSPELWSKMAELGWLGLPFAEQYGGLGSSFLDLCVLLEEMGRACLPSPFFSTVILSGLAIADAGDDAQKQDFLTAIANGERIVAFAFDESSGGYDAASIALEAHHQGDHYTVKGTKLFVEFANVADWLLCVARTKKAHKPEEGITLLLVKNEKPGVTCTVMPTLAKDKQCEVVFDGARGYVLGQPDHGWAEVARLVQRAAVAKSLEMVGGAQQVLEMSVAYAKERVQFDKPIASFQAIQHHCANMALERGYRPAAGLPGRLQDRRRAALRHRRGYGQGLGQRRLSAGSHAGAPGARRHRLHAGPRYAALLAAGQGRRGGPGRRRLPPRAAGASARSLTPIPDERQRRVC